MTPDDEARVRAALGKLAFGGSLIRQAAPDIGALISHPEGRSKLLEICTAEVIREYQPKDVNGADAVRHPWRAASGEAISSEQREPFLDPFRVRTLKGGRLPPREPAIAMIRLQQHDRIAHRVLEDLVHGLDQESVGALDLCRVELPDLRFLHFVECGGPAGLGG